MELRNTLVAELAAPLARRIGTALAGAIAALGASDALVSDVQALVVGTFLVGIDLWLSHAARKMAS